MRVLRLRVVHKIEENLFAWCWALQNRFPINNQNHYDTQINACMQNPLRRRAGYTAYCTPNIYGKQGRENSNIVQSTKYIRMMLKDHAIGKKLSTLVEEQLKYCRSLRQADLMLITHQSAPTDAECLEQANSLILLLKADVRALNACASRFLPPSKADHAAADFSSSSTGTSEVAVSAYGVEAIERLFRNFGQIDTSDSSKGLQAISATNQLVAIRERLQAGLSARLLVLKSEMENEFGAAFLDMEAYLRVEKETQAKSDVGHCSTCVRLFVELCTKFQVMVHACRGLRAAKEGLNQTVLLKDLQEERDAIAERLERAEAELKRVHQSYTEIMTPEVAVSLANRQRHKVEEQDADIERLKAETESLKREQQRLLAENGRFSDVVAELQAQLQSNKDTHGRELAWLAAKVLTAESRAAEIEGLVDHMNLRLSLLGSSHKKACEELQDVKAQLTEAREVGSGVELSKLQREVLSNQTAIRRLQSELKWKDRLVTVAMSARSTAQDAYREMKRQSENIEKQLRETQGACALQQAQKKNLMGKLEAGKASLVAAEEREGGLKEEIQKMAETISLAEQESEILRERLDNQEMKLRDFSNLQKEHEELSASNKDTVYKLQTVTGLYKDITEKAIRSGMSRKLGLG